MRANNCFVSVISSVVVTLIFWFGYYIIDLPFSYFEPKNTDPKYLELLDDWDMKDQKAASLKKWDELEYPLQDYRIFLVKGNDPSGSFHITLPGDLWYFETAGGEGCTGATIVATINGQEASYDLSYDGFSYLETESYREARYKVKVTGIELEEGYDEAYVAVIVY